VGGTVAGGTVAGGAVVGGTVVGATMDVGTAADTVTRVAASAWPGQLTVMNREPATTHTATG
jgi:hypothetical protein